MTDELEQLLNNSRNNNGTLIPPTLPSNQTNKRESKQQIYKILIVDDDKQFRSSIKSNLDNNFYIDLAENGNQAIELVKTAKNNQDPYYAIVMDVIMEGLSGFETSRNIKIIDNNIPIIILTGEAKQIQPEDLKIGINEYLIKDKNLIVGNKLLNTIDNACHYYDSINKNHEFQIQLDLYKFALGVIAQYTHDLNNAIMIALGNGELEKMKLVEFMSTPIYQKIISRLEIDEKQILNEFLTAMSNSNSKKQNSLKKMTDISKAIMNKTRQDYQISEEMMPTQIYLKRFIDGIVEDIKCTKDYKKLKDQIRIICDYNTPKIIRAPKNHIESVFKNLLINSVHAIDEKGEYGEIYVKSEVSDYLIFTIKDTGIGIPEDKIDKICNLFYTTKKTGNGIGLSTVASIINKNNGKLNYESKYGEGTKFEIYLNKDLFVIE